MQDKINNILSSEFNVSKTSRLLVACSGGMDSMVLSHILLDLGYSIQLAHVNYNLRGEDSILDKKLVEDFA
ncbi:MAG: ATP-binding protein, partial [Saprospiraceae bacterium]|nr:ATP-binding protein [Saprospiraceae bacterium]